MPFAAMPPDVPLVPIVQVGAADQAAAASPAGRSIVDARDGGFVIVASRAPVSPSLPASPLALGRSVRIDRALLAQDRQPNRDVQP